MCVCASLSLCLCRVYAASRDSTSESRHLCLVCVNVCPLLAAARGQADAFSLFLSLWKRVLPATPPNHAKGGEKSKTQTNCVCSDGFEMRFWHVFFSPALVRAFCFASSYPPFGSTLFAPGHQPSTHIALATTTALVDATAAARCFTRARMRQTAASPRRKGRRACAAETVRGGE